MKRIIFILAALVASLSMHAATPIDDVLKEANKNVPVEMQTGMTFEGITDTDTAVVFNFLLSDDVYSQMAPFVEMMHDSILAELLSNQDAVSKSILAYCRENGKNIIQRFTNSKKEHVDVVVKASELK